ncbi:unnamed protein product [Ectocarpus fasciculatus]
MPPALNDVAAETTKLAVKIGSAAVDGITVMAGLCEELPAVEPLLKTLRIIRETMETVKSNREKLAALDERCTYLTANVVVRCRQNIPASEIDVFHLEQCINTVGKLVDACSERGKVSRVFKAKEVDREINGLNVRLDSLTSDMGLAGVATAIVKIDKIAASVDAQTVMIGSLLPSQTKTAKVPRGTPLRKSWQIERTHVMDAVSAALISDGGPRLVGLVGRSGSGKTTAASEFVRSTNARKAFSDGVVWLSVNEGAKERLPSLMLQLAGAVFEDIGGCVGNRPVAPADGAAYVKQRVEDGNDGKGLKCLVVADNVWEPEVVSKLLETGMSVLLSTRDQQLVTGAQGQPVGVDELSPADARSVLRGAAEIAPEVPLPADADDLIDLSGRVAMGLAFIGRWSNVRRQEGRTAWSDATSAIRAEIDKAGLGPGCDSTEDAHAKRQKAILQAGFNNLATGVDDERVQRLYLSLGVLPDGYAFTAKDAAVLLDEVSVEDVVDVLERWSVVRSEEGGYHVHDAHLSFARESLEDYGYVRRSAVKSWVGFISTLDVLRSVGPYVLKGLWLAVKNVGGDDWDGTRLYQASLAELSGSDPVVLRKTLDALATFQEVQEDWKGSMITTRELLRVEKRDLGENHPFVLNSYQKLAACAERLQNTEEASEWRTKELEALPLALAKIQEQLDAGEIEGLDGADGLTSLASTILMLAPGDRDEAEKLLRRSLEMQEAELGEDTAKLAPTLYQLAVCVRDAGRLDEAKKLLLRRLRIEDPVGDRKDAELATTLLNLGACLRLAEQWEEAESVLRRCLSIQETESGPESEALVGTLANLAACFKDAERAGEAEDLLRRCLTILEHNLAPNSLVIASRLYELAVCVDATGRRDEAKGLMIRRLAIQETKLGSNHPRVGKTVFQLGVWAREAEEWEEAKKYICRSLEIQEAAWGLESERLSATLANLAFCFSQTGQLGEAEGIQRRCLTILDNKLGPNDPRVASRLYELAVCVHAAGDVSEATELMTRRLGILESIPGVDVMKIARTLRQLGVWAREAGQWEKAEEVCKRCLALIPESEIRREDAVEIRRDALDQLARCVVHKAGSLKEAEELLMRREEMQSRYFPHSLMGGTFFAGANTVVVLRKLAAYVREEGRQDEADELLRRSQEQEEEWRMELDLPIHEIEQEEEGQRMMMRCFSIHSVPDKVSPFFWFAVFFGGLSCVAYFLLK